MKNLAILILFTILAGIAGQQCGLMAGKVSGCEISYRRLYKKLEMKYVDEASLHEFCLKEVQ